MTFALNANTSAAAKNGVVLHRYSDEEYQRLVSTGAVRGSDPVELIEGLIALGKDAMPPYEFPVGIPPEILWEGERLLDRRPLRRLTVPEFDRMVDAGILSKMRFELAEGWVVDKMSRSPRHDTVVCLLFDAIRAAAPAGFIVRNQMSVTLDESKYEPDITVVPGTIETYARRHPVASEVLLLVEVSHATLRFDRGIKRRDYARNGVETYWVVDVVKNRIEVNTGPSGPTVEPGYDKCEVFGKGEKIAVVRGGKTLMEAAVDDVLAL